MEEGEGPGAVAVMAPLVEVDAEGGLGERKWE